MHFSDDAQALTEENRALKEAEGRGKAIPLDFLDDSPYHIGELEPERVKALEDNLKHNPQSSPVVVRLKADGRYELLAGRHRVRALRNLGRTEVEAVIKAVDDQQALRIVVYDNHITPNLSDYQKYLGFERIRQERELTVTELAEESGVSLPVLQKIMLFTKLPPAAQEVIRASHRSFGANLFAGLAPLVDDYSDQVTEAVKLVAAGKLKQGAAVAWVTKPGTENAPEPVSVAVMSGKRRYAEIRVKKAGRLEIDFVRAEDASGIVKKLQEFLQQAAKAS
ncbi:ParB/RepB/Spo0J family partition protein [Methylibium petroleiphilum]|uniref:ParB, partition protein n=1 Tax=Methylibium petroleiphilum (strain ATCC BAA-1232 / LMG 22953 / PM1) TaxID=420662 RepID=A2SMQ6_METPP|nr:ParB/RepB/Spo0J family partition protein [Methylibium petroleiphilum]ABM96845.1 ParB, partition protein [Methylibium petroleiphilum PM1]